jgi:hypothetical protein
VPDPKILLKEGAQVGALRLDLPAVRREVRRQPRQKKVVLRPLSQARLGGADAPEEAAPDRSCSWCGFPIGPDRPRTALYCGMPCARRAQRQRAVARGYYARR